MTPRKYLMSCQSNDGGYTKDEYYKISAKESLPKRCPILGKCCRAVWTRYVLGFGVTTHKISWDEFLKSEGQRWEPERMIKEVEQLEWGSSSILFFAKNTCPEVTLFEPEYLPRPLRPSAFGEVHHYEESKRSDITARHYCECAEFSEYIFHQGINSSKRRSSQKRKRSPISETLKIEIFQRDEFRCHYCKRHKEELPLGVSLTLDHKVPYADGGDDSFGNLVAACSDCNNGKSNKVINNL
jgi:hypothetical protein